MISTKRMCAVLALAAFAPPGASADGVFKNIAFDAALKQAAAEKKFIFIDFFTTWCGPCKMMDESTFKDEAVVKWLGEKTVPLKLDAEREVALAEKFHVEFYPTLLFLKPGGEEYERLLGYLDPKEFLAAAHGLEKGETALDRARRAVEAAPDDLQARFELGKAQAMRGMQAEALATLLACLDRDQEGGSDLFDGPGGGLAVFVAQQLAELADAYPPARDELLKRRDAAEQRVLAPAPARGDVVLFAALCRVSGDASRLLAVYDKVVARGPAADVADAFHPFVFPLLLAAHRYQDIAKVTDIGARVDQALASAGEVPPKFATLPAEQRAEFHAMVVRQAVMDLSNYYQVLWGLGRAEEAKAVADRIFALDDSADTYNALAWAGYLTGQPGVEHLDMARKAWEQTGQSRIDVFDTLVRIMFVRGDKDQAIALCEEALAKAESERDKWAIQQCLTDFRPANQSRDREGAEPSPRP